jgi:hypothetical protein
VIETTDVHNSDKPQKLQYIEPRLVVMGDVRVLTLGGSPSNPEESGGTVPRRN